jgi:hypothetical protein
MRQTITTCATAQGSSPIRRLLLRRVWIPASLYAAVPGLYLGTGALAFRSLWLIPGWSLVHSCFCMLGVGCSYAGAAVITLRWQNWRRRRAVAATTAIRV